MTKKKNHAQSQTVQMTMDAMIQELFLKALNKTDMEAKKKTQNMTCSHQEQNNKVLNKWNDKHQ